MYSRYLSRWLLKNNNNVSLNLPCKFVLLIGFSALPLEKPIPTKEVEEEKEKFGDEDDDEGEDFEEEDDEDFDEDEDEEEDEEDEDEDEDEDEEQDDDIDHKKVLSDFYNVRPRTLSLDLE